MVGLQVGGVHVHYDDAGDGAPVVLVHGGATTSRYWDAVRAELPNGIRTITPDLYGCGSTDPCAAQQVLTHDDEAVLVRAVIDAVGKSVHLVGHSYGAAVCLRAAVFLQAGIRSMTLIEPPIYGLLLQSGLTDLYGEISTFRNTFEDRVTKGEDEAAMELLVDRFSGNGTWAKMSTNMHTNLLGVVQPLLVGFAANAQNPTRIEDCRGIEIPTLLPWGDQTGEPEKAMVTLLGQWLPHARTMPIPGARHQSPISHPQEVAQLIAGHVAQHDSSQPPT
jgi:pimeloyl-ACP methyl ester carboxylesterase